MSNQVMPEGELSPADLKGSRGFWRLTEKIKEAKELTLTFKEDIARVERKADYLYLLMKGMIRPDVLDHPQNPWRPKEVDDAAPSA